MFYKSSKTCELSMIMKVSLLVSKLELESSS